MGLLATNSGLERRASSIVMAVVIVWTTAAAGQAVEESAEAPAEARSLGVLAPFLLYGQDPDGPWIGETDGNGYRLINPEDPSAITFFFVGTPEEDEGKRTLAIKTVVLQGDGKIGLIYGYQEQPKQYHLLVVDANGLAQVFHRPPEGGLNEVLHANIERPAGEDGQPVGPSVITLKLVENGNTATALINDIEIGQLEGPGIGRGNVGIAAAGRIDGLFLDFLLQTAD